MGRGGRLCVRRRRDGVQNVRREPSIRARSSHPRARPTHLTLVRLTSPPRPRVHSRSPRRDVRVDVIDPLSIVVGGAVVTAGRGLLERSFSTDEQATPVVPRNALPDSVVSDEGLVRADTVGTLPAIQHSYAGVFDAAGTAKCGLERAYFEGKTQWRKPMSCHLYPIRVKELLDFTALNYHQWHICEAARLCGKAGKITVLDFCKDALVRRFGEAWYEEAQQAQTLWQQSQS